MMLRLELKVLNLMNMATKYCATCLRVLRWQMLSAPLTINISRGFSRTRLVYTVLPEPNARPAASIPPVAPHRAEGGPTVKDTTPALKTAAAEFRRVTGKFTETYTVYGATERMFMECTKQAEYIIPQASDPNAEMPKTTDGEDLGVGDGWWHKELGLKPTFSTWSQVTMLHMYILVARIRCLPQAQFSIWQQHLLDHFFYAAEDRMTVTHHMHARGTRNKYLKDLFLQWRGLLVAYDEGLVKGDPVLAAAVWRNVFKGDEEVDVGKVAMVVGFMRRSIQSLEALSDEDLQLEGTIFGDHGSEAEMVNRSKMMDLPFEDGKVTR